MNTNNPLSAKLAEEFWLRHLSGAENQVPILPILSSSGETNNELTDSNYRETIRIPSSITNIMNNRFTGDKGPVNKFLIYISILKLLYHEYTGATDIITGTTDVRFPGLTHDPERLIFLRSSIKVDDETTFKDQLKQEQQVLLKALENHRYDTPGFLKKYRLNYPDQESNIFNVGIYYNRFNYPTQQANRFDVIVTVNEPEEYKNETPATLEIHCTNQLKRPQVKFFMENYLHTLQYVLENRETKLSEIQIICKKEQQLIEKYSAPEIEFPINKNALELFFEQADQTPFAIAIVYRDKQLSYKELKKQSLNYAQLFRNQFNLTGEDVVGILMDRSDQMVIAVIGAMAAGCAYVFIDPANPPERNSYILKDTSCKLLITESKYIESSQSYWNGAITTIDNVINPLSPLEKDITVTRIDIESTAFIIYTSGSTGTPKGILQTHRCLVNVVMRQAHYGGFEKNLRVLQFSSAGFDVFIAHELFYTLLTGGKLEIVSENDKRDIPFLGNFIMERNIEWLLLPVTVLNIIFDLCTKLWKETIAIKHIIATGEKLQLTPLLITYLKEHPQIYLHNFYGPAETHNASNYTLPAGNFNPVPPIGKPSTNTWIYILSPRWCFVPIGVPGEIYIAGAGVAKGYLNQPTTTAEKFLLKILPFFSNSFQSTVYKTGDLARWQPDGNMDFLGRIDHQVKIRGIRIEPGEIELRLKTHEKIKEAIVIVKESEPGEKFLCAYIVLQSPDLIKTVSSSEIRDFLSNTLPAHMIPSLIIPIETIPLNASGKIDRKALPEPNTDSTKPVYAPPRDHIEETMIRLWSDILGKDTESTSPLGKLIGIDDNFFELGGHSLTAAIVLSRIHKEFGVKIPFSDIFKKPTVRLLGETIRGAEIKCYIPIVPLEKKEYYELSHSQRQLWVLNQINKNNTAYIMPGSTEFDTINKTAFEKTIHTIIKRHESLRTTFIRIDGQPKQIIHDTETFDFNTNYIDIRNTENKENTIELLKRNEKETPFDLEKGPLVRLNIVNITDTRNLLLFTLHHIISDGWSMVILEDEIIKTYNSICNQESCPLPPLKIHYKDFSAWQNLQDENQTTGKHREYWMQKFNPKPPVLNMKTDFPRQINRTFRGKNIRWALEKETWEELKKLTMQNNVSMIMLLLAILKTLLFRYTGQEDIVIGLPVAGRENAELQNQVGFYINTLALRTIFSGGQETFQQLLNHVKQALLEAYEHQAYPFDSLLADLELERNTGRFPLFDIVLQYLKFEGITGTGNDDKEHSAMEGVTLTPIPLDINSSKFDLTWNFSETQNTLTGNIIYNADLFEVESIIVMIEKFKILSRQIIGFPTNKPIEFEINLEMEKQIKESTNPQDFGFDFEN